VSPENVEVFKRAIAAGNRRDVEALLEKFHPEVEYHAVLPMLGRDAVYRGHDGVREFLRDVMEPWSDAQFEAGAIREAGDRVVALGHWRGHGKASGAEAEMPFGYVVEFKDGKVIRVHTYLDPNEALEAAGLAE
jgi:ketosteroid isomerase-like protein